MEPLIRRIRNEMGGAEMNVENSKGECNFGQHEINFHYGGALRVADDHAIYKNGVKEIAAQEGMALTFIAKFNELEGNSCHIHCSLAKEDGTNAFGEDQTLFERFVAGQIACMRDLTLFFAPQINSYKRFAEGSFAPTAVAWGKDNRTCALRAVGHGHSLRIENRLPGADVNPYLALSAMIAAGLHGIENELALEPPLEGNAYTADKPRVPSTLRDARDDLRRERRGARGVRPGGGGPLPQPRATWSWRPSTRPSPTGRSSAASNGCDSRRHLRRHRAGPLGGLGDGGEPVPAQLRARGPGGGRARPDPARPTTARWRTPTRCSTASTR